LADKVLRLHPSRGFFFGAGLHLVNPEKPIVVLHPEYTAPQEVLRGIKSGVLIDVNENILVEAKDNKPKGKEAEKKNEKPVTPPAEEAPKEEAPAKEVTEEVVVESAEEETVEPEEVKEEEVEEKPKAKTKPKAKAKAKDKE